MALTFHVEHFGCRAARADGEAVSGRLRVAGLWEGEPSAADVVIVNTCSVTAEADRAARAFIRRAHRVNPAARIVVTGCYAQRAPEDLAGMAGVAAVVGNSHKALAPEIVLGLARDGAGVGLAAPKELVSVESIVAGGARASAPVWADDRFAHSFLEEAQVVPGAQTRPNLKIQEGCGNRCSFCVIPQTRGSSRSLPAAAILKQVEGFVAAGGKELVLSGINLGRWGRDLAGPAYERTDRDSRFPTLSAEGGDAGSSTSVAAATFAQKDRALGEEASAPRSLAGLARRILEQTGLARLRLSSIEPMDWDAELIGLMAEFAHPNSSSPRLARHAHLPLQSGSDAVLRRMHRRYRPWHYVEKVEALLRAAGPELTLGADVMVGFPGETDAEFEETLELVRSVPFAYLHLFPFSPRPGTPAWALHAQRPVRAAVVEERMAVLRALAAEKSQAHRRRFVGRELEAITLRTPAEMTARGRTAALTENFLPVELEGRLDSNRLVRLRVTGLTAEGTLKAVLEPAEGIQYAATAMSVRAKSVPLKSNSSPVSLARA
ncbi:MAG: radical SAM protein [Terracidiphilus sp.]|jgi:threonylcarbamoyladenosine tRNA methylthiotransferase MtaB